MKQLTINDLNALLRILTTTALRVNKDRQEKGLSMKRLRICPQCQEVSEAATCTHQKEMH